MATKTIHYKGKDYTVRTILYHEKTETPEEAITALVSTNELNDILFADTQSTDKSLRNTAVQVDERIAFFLPENEIKNTGKKFVSDILHRDHPDYLFIDVE